MSVLKPKVKGAMDAIGSNFNEERESEINGEPC